MKKKLPFFLLFLCLAIEHTALIAKNYVIYAISQKVPMGEETEKLEKVYYINIGKRQGVYPETKLQVLRRHSMTDPRDSRKRYLHEVKMASLKVVVSEDEHAMAIMHNKNEQLDFLMNYPSPMIGDKIDIALKKEP